MILEIGIGLEKQFKVVLAQTNGKKFLVDVNA